MIRIRAADEVEQVGRRPLVHRDRRDDDLREHVQRVMHDARRLDVTVPHCVDDAGHLHGIVEEGRHEHASTHRAYRVPRPADALQAVRDALGALELNHEIDGADVDAKLERARAHERAQITRLEPLLEQQSALAGE